eukprot:m.73361 g.73361  ORF g.73361 m.73361 type:complete len:365 (-) comp8419_c0_seq1:2194-3288(-)
MECPSAKNDIKHDMQCKICLDSEESSGNKLISPCKCKGSMKYVHETCLLEWTESRFGEYATEGQCQYCHEKYKVQTNFGWFLRATRWARDGISTITPHLAFLGIGVCVLSGLSVYGGVVYSFVKDVTLSEMYEKRSPLQWFSILPAIPLSLIAAQLVADMGYSNANMAQVSEIAAENMNFPHMDLIRELQDQNERIDNVNEAFANQRIIAIDVENTEAVEDATNEEEGRNVYDFDEDNSIAANVDDFDWLALDEDIMTWDDDELLQEFEDELAGEAFDNHFMNNNFRGMKEFDITHTILKALTMPFFALGIGQLLHHYIPKLDSVQRFALGVISYEIIIDTLGMEYYRQLGHSKLSKRIVILSN